MTDATQRGPYAEAFHDLLKPNTPPDAAPFDFAAFEDVDRADVRIKDPTTGAATAMVITHNSAIAGMADRVIRLVDGRVDRIEVPPQRLTPAQLSW